jgi:hypothetical protein
MAPAVAAFPIQEMAMTAARQFLVTLDGYEPGDRSPDVAAHALKYAIANMPTTAMEGGFDDVTVVALPDLAADDTGLQIGFRNLAAAARSNQRSVGTVISKEQAAALVAELSKQHPARTSHVDQSALDAMRAIRDSDKRPGQQVQKDAHVQLIITDAICRCVPEVGRS